MLCLQTAAASKFRWVGLTNTLSCHCCSELIETANMQTCTTAIAQRQQCVLTVVLTVTQPSLL